MADLEAPDPGERIQRTHPKEHVSHGLGGVCGQILGRVPAHIAGSYLFWRFARNRQGTGKTVYWDVSLTESDERTGDERGDDTVTMPKDTAGGASRQSGGTFRVQAERRKIIGLTLEREDRVQTPPVGRDPPDSLILVPRS